jgi:hypothetical protein
MPCGREFNGTRAEVLDGFNGSVSTDNVPDASRPLAKTFTTGWVANPDSDVLVAWAFRRLSAANG